MKPHLVTIAVLAAGLAAVAAIGASPASAAPAPASAFFEAPCPPDFPATWRCLSVQAPARYDGAASKTATVRVVVAPARHPSGHPKAVFLIQGAPGLSGTAVAGRGFIASIGGLQDDAGKAALPARPEAP
jgi:hypothetical protein